MKKTSLKEQKKFVSGRIENIPAEVDAIVDEISEYTGIKKMKLQRQMYFKGVEVYRKEMQDGKLQKLK